MSRFLEASSHRLSLRRMIEEFVPGDWLERAHRDAILELLEAPSDVCSREHYVPGHLTASAFVVSPDDSALLLIHHAKLGRWLQPGGHVEPSDASLLHAALREAREETSLEDLELIEGPFDVDVHEIPARKAAPAHRHFDVRFLFRAKTRVLRAESDALDARWFRWTELQQVESDESVLRAVRKLYARGLCHSDGLPASPHEKL